MTSASPREPGAVAPRGLWHHADFLRLWSAQAISAFGTRITRTALPIIAVALGEPESALGVLAAMQLAPGVVLAMFAGGFVDRSHKRRILVVADVVRAALVASLTLAWVFDVLTIQQVVLVGAGVGAASALFQIADVAYLPSLIGRRHLAEGNAKLETTEAIAEITGPASAGVLISALGAPLAVALDAASYVWSALMLGRIQSRERLPAASPPAAPAVAGDGEPPETEPAVSTGEDFRIGLAAIFGNPLVRPIVLCLMVWSLAGGFFITLYTPYCLRALAIPESMFGVIIAMGGIGSLAGAVVARALSRRFGVGRTLLVTSALSTAFGLLIPLAATTSARPVAFGLLIAHQLLGDGFAVAFIVLAVTLRQTVLPRGLLGRANAAVHVCTTGVLPIASLLAGGVSAALGLRTAVAIGVIVGLAAPLCLWPLRRLKDMPAPELSASDSGLPRAVAAREAGEP